MYLKNNTAPLYNLEHHFRTLFGVFSTTYKTYLKSFSFENKSKPPISY